VDAEELGGEVHRGTLGGLAGFFPAAGADAAELRAGFAQADVAADEVRLLQRDVEGDVVVEFEGDHLADALHGIEFRETAVERDAVLEVDDKIAFDQLGEIEELVDLGALGDGAGVERRAALALAAEDFGLGDDDEAGGGRGGFFEGGAIRAPSRKVMRKPSLREPRRKRGLMRFSAVSSARISSVRCSSPSFETTKMTPYPDLRHAATWTRNARRASSSTCRRSCATRESSG
jgi:hypothetical protein